ncbi:hypothetical protein ACN6MY_14915 [Peribacillus sp. B-H-3]|uniref:hypothetical protein n=1 Tax=Peribacillus sp. B-H-3 TaxID=3400420 RepID=UPI003B027C1A
MSISFSELQIAAKRLDNLHTLISTWETMSNASDTEVELLNIIDHLTRVSSMLCTVIKDDLADETDDPAGYIARKITISEEAINCYLLQKQKFQL